MPSVSQFISSIKLDKADEMCLVQHIQDCHANASGPNLDDRCTDRVRKYLKQKPPLGLSWHGSIKLDGHLSAGFTSNFRAFKEAYQMGIPAIGIVAVLVANVTFIAWSTPPGGSQPYWAGCDYPIFTAFLIVNGIAFMLSVASVIVVTAFPLVLKRTPHQAAGWGDVLLLLSMIAFIGAFVLAGFVTVAYKAPVPGCASLLCNDGGVECHTAVTLGDDVAAYVLDPNVAALNKLVPTENDSSAVCLQYNDSAATGADTAILQPATPSCPGSAEYESSREWDTCRDVKELLEDASVQQQVVCASPASFQSYFATDALSSDTLSLAVNWSTTPYTSLTHFYQADPSNYITDLMSLDNGLGNNTFQLDPYAGMTYLCQSNADDASSYNTLCDTYQSFSVSKRRDYITEATASAAGATVFHADKNSAQLAITVKILSGFFGAVLLIIIGYLIKSKLR